jgi:hypothetical protein
MSRACKGSTEVDSAVHRDPVHRDTSASRAEAVDRHRRRRLRNALAETTIGLYKTECVRDSSLFQSGPLARLADLEGATSAWVHWYNTARLMHGFGRARPRRPKPSTTLTVRPPSRPDHTKRGVHKTRDASMYSGASARLLTRPDWWARSGPRGNCGTASYPCCRMRECR